MTASRISRRHFLRHLIRATALTGGVTAAYSSGYERRRPVLTHHQLPVPGLRESQYGIRVAQLSDLHVDDWTPQVTLHRSVDLIRAQQPDLIVLTGDFISRSTNQLAERLQPLTQLKAPHGIYASLGNHDMRQQASICETLEQLGIQPLRNSATRIQAPGGPLNLCGLDSAWQGLPMPKTALRHYRPNEPLLVLMHEPDYAANLAADGLRAAQLSGHTHGGQVCAPWWGVIKTTHWGRNYTRGSYQVGDVHLYVNSGIGCIGVPFRFLCPPEITLHHLIPV